MLNFKQFLKENTRNDINYIFNYNVIFNATENHDIDEVIELFKGLLEKELKIHIPLKIKEITLTPYATLDYHVCIKFDISSTGILLQEAKDIEKKVDDILKNYDFITLRNNGWTPYIFIFEYNEPSFKIEYKEIYLNFNSKCNIKNIHKIIKCKDLQIYTAFNITGNILGLLQLRNEGTKITISKSPENKNFGWIELLKKAIKNKQKDILDFKEELVNAGFKDYAKF